jgi:hypothetical protein
MVSFLVVGALATAASALQTAVWGTWSGKSGFIGAPLPADRMSTMKVKVRPARLDVSSTGPTGASHDAPSARGTCSLSFRFDRVANGWRHYAQVGGGVVTGEGGLETAPCWGSKRQGTIVARLRPAGAKLKIEFAQMASADPLWRAYLTRVAP